MHIHESLHSQAISLCRPTRGSFTCSCPSSTQCTAERPINQQSKYIFKIVSIHIQLQNSCHTFPDPHFSPKIQITDSCSTSAYSRPTAPTQHQNQVWSSSKSPICSLVLSCSTHYTCSFPNSCWINMLLNALVIILHTSHVAAKESTCVALVD